MGREEVGTVLQPPQASLQALYPKPAFTKHAEALVCVRDTKAQQGFRSV